jgi:hypothetical protein
VPEQPAYGGGPKFRLTLWYGVAGGVLGATLDAAARNRAESFCRKLKGSGVGAGLAVMNIVRRNRWKLVVG